MIFLFLLAKLPLKRMPKQELQLKSEKDAGKCLDMLLLSHLYYTALRGIQSEDICSRDELEEDKDVCKQTFNYFTRFF